MPPSTLLQRLKLRHKIAALGVVGMALCLLPLIQLLRYQGLELQWARAAQDQLEPAVLAVALQRGLVDHRGSAAQWLQGRQPADALRRQHQAVVDARLAMLDHRLSQAGQQPALDEVAAMRADWLALVQRIIQARCSVADSDAGHRLLVEQTLQVIDIVSAALAALPDAAPLQQATVQARAQLQAGPQAWPAALATLQAAQAQVQQAQTQRVALHQARRTLSAAGLLALAVGIVGLLAWLRAARRRVPKAAAQHPGQAASTPAPGWRMPRPDGQQPLHQARQGLLHRLRRPAPEAPRLDQPTQPQEP